MSDINAAIAKVSEGIKELAEALAKSLAEVGKEINSTFKELAEAFNEARKKCEQEEQKQLMRAKRPDYKQYKQAATKPPYIKQDRKSTGKRGV